MWHLITVLKYTLCCTKHARRTQYIHAYSGDPHLTLDYRARVRVQVWQSCDRDTKLHTHVYSHYCTLGYTITTARTYVPYHQILRCLLDRVRFVPSLSVSLSASSKYAPLQRPRTT